MLTEKLCTSKIWIDAGSFKCLLFIAMKPKTHTGGTKEGYEIWPQPRIMGSKIRTFLLNFEALCTSICSKKNMLQQC